MKRHFPDFIEAYLKFTKDHESTDRIRKWTILSVLAGAMERKVWMDRGHYTLYPNLYVFIIAKSGLLKKSTSTAIGVNLLKELEDIRFMSERLTAASLVQQLGKAQSSFEHEGHNIKQSALFAYGSELAVMMGEVFGSIIELLTTFYDCIPHDSTKPWVNKSKHSGDDNIYGPCLNILGASTKEWLRKCIPDSEMIGGFTSRVVFVVENNRPDNLVAWPKMDAELKEHRQKLVDDLEAISKLVGQVRVSQEVRDAFTSWYHHHMNNVVAKNNDPRWSGYLSRKGDLLLKLAMVRCVSLSNDLVINQRHFDWAGREIEALEVDMMKAFSKAQNRLSDEDILKYLSTHGKTTATILNQEFGLSGNELGRCLANAIEIGTCVWSFNPETKDQFYEVNNG
jgi:hypothetical protein